MSMRWAACPTLKTSLCNRQRRPGAELRGEECVIGAAPRNQLLMLAGFDRPSALDNPNPVGADDRLQAMGDDERGASHPQIVQRLLHFPLGFRIKRGGRFVEKQDRRILQNSA